MRAFASQAQSIGDRRGGLPVQYVLQAQTLEKLKEKIPDFMEAVNSSDKFIFADINLKFTKPELEIEIDREKARNIGVSVQEIAPNLAAFLFRTAICLFYHERKAISGGRRNANRRPKRAD